MNSKLNENKSESVKIKTIKDLNPSEDFKLVLNWLEQNGKRQSEEWQLADNLLSAFESWESGENESWNQSGYDGFISRQSQNLTTLISYLDDYNNFQNKDTRQSLSVLLEWLKKECIKCGSCSRTANNKYGDELIKCQKCKYYFCSLACWGEGNDYYCQDCKNGNALKYSNIV